jgi:hypothetical protein
MIKKLWGLHTLQTFGKKVPYVNVTKRVIGDLSILSIFDQIEIAQDPKLMRNSRLGLP